MYRASRDGFSVSDFHSKCNGIENTFTVVKSESGDVFGRYTDKTWNTDTFFENVTDPDAFIFSLTNDEDKLFKFICYDGGQNASHCEPLFGSYSSSIYSADNSNNKSQSNAEKEKNWKILAGSYNFKTAEIEVYTKTKVN